MIKKLNQSKKLGVTMKKSVVFKTIAVVTLIVLVSVGALNFIYIQNARSEIIEAAGIELVGCAHITTGLIDSQLLEASLDGDGMAGEKLSEIINWTIEKKPIFDSHYILSLDGEIIALDEHLQKDGFQLGDTFYFEEEKLQSILDGNHATFTEVYEFGGKKRITGYAPIYKNNDPNEEIIAINAIDFHEDIINERLWNTVKNTLLLSITLPFIAAIITGFYMRRVLSPIKSIMNVQKQITNKDLTANDLQINRSDELGSLSNGMNTMRKTLKELIEKMKNTSANVSSTSAFLNEQIDALRDAREKVIESVEVVQEGSIHQVEQVEHTVDAFHAFGEEIRSINGMATEAAKNSDDAKNIAVKGIEDLTHFKEKMDGIDSHANHTLTEVHTLKEMTKNIGKMVSIISEITDKTNMLALNASIEAARAGEHGKGFSVVAEEVRKLSSETNEATKTIQDIATEMEERVNKTVENVEWNQAEVKDGVASINELMESFNRIEQMTKNTAKEMEQVLLSLQRGEEQLNEVENYMEITKETANLSSSQAEEMSAVTEEQAAMYDEMVQYLKELHTMANSLDEIINEFKV